jgi:predicted nucleic acid-binding protein
MAPSLLVVDASVWVARLISDDAHHATTSEWLAAFTRSEGQLISPSLMLPEIAGAVSRRTGRQDLALAATKSLQQLGNLQIVRMDDRLISDAADIAARYSLRGADSIYVALARRLSAPLLSFDAEHAARGGKIVEVINPIRG